MDGFNANSHVNGKIPVVAVVGPTASGKSALAVELALRFNGEVVSADSMQIYRNVPVGTAQPSEPEKKGIPHHMVAFQNLDEPFSVADYVERAAQCIAGIDSRGKLPILAGGTGLYVRSLLENIQFSEQESNPELRRQLTERANQEGAESLWKELENLDPACAKQVDSGNIKRVVRALELYYTTGMQLEERLALSRSVPSPYLPFKIGLNFRNRASLYEHIDRRVDWMLEHGLLEEAEQVLRLPPEITARQAIGYKEFDAYFSGEQTLRQAAECLKRESRRYAKRQLTWFRREKELHWLYVDDFTAPEALFEQAAREVKSFFGTLETKKEAQVNE